MDIRTVPIGRGVDWISGGFGIFKRNPLIWIVILVIFLAIFVILSVIPFLGGIAAMLLQPVLIGGMLWGCHVLERDEELRIEHLFEGFRQNTNQLVMVGLISGLAYLLVFIVIGAVVGGSVLGLSALGGFDHQPDLAMGGALIGFIFSGLIGLALTIPIAMAVWFAPALVIFRNMPALDAMKASFFACWRNVLPFLLYGIIALVLTVVAMIPLGLGLLVVGPTLIASVYVGYQDIFGND
ncbi:MAG: BPSS1780 family membrane protein [Methylococcaceae bacterium]|nr:BPSS1780 family membrane protein [Methylococcaceae bacterium]